MLHFSYVESNRPSTPQKVEMPGLLVLKPRQDALSEESRVPSDTLRTILQQGRPLFVWPSPGYRVQLELDHALGYCPVRLLKEQSNIPAGRAGSICPCKDCLDVEVLPMCDACSRLAMFTACVSCLVRSSGRDVRVLRQRVCPNQDCQRRLSLAKCPECTVRKSFPELDNAKRRAEGLEEARYDPSRHGGMDRWALLVSKTQW